MQASVDNDSNGTFSSLLLLFHSSSFLLLRFILSSSSSSSPFTCFRLTYVRATVAVLLRRTRPLPPSPTPPIPPPSPAAAASPFGGRHGWREEGGKAFFLPPLHARPPFPSPLRRTRERALRREESVSQPLSRIPFFPPLSLFLEAPLPHRRRRSGLRTLSPPSWLDV